MKCKNCNYELPETALYCEHCGAKVIKQRLTIKNNWKEFESNFLGWDSKVIQTFKALLTAPDKVFDFYIEGGRKKYLNPYNMLGLSLTIAAFYFSIYGNETVNKEREALKNGIVNIGDTFKNINNEYRFIKTPKKNEFSKVYKAGYEAGKDSSKKNIGPSLVSLINFTVKYFNIFSLLTIPIFSIMALLIFNRRGLNFSEHFIINTYIFSFAMIPVLLVYYLFLSNANFIFLILLIPFFSFIYAYTKEFDLKKRQSVLVALKLFLGIAILTSFIFFVFTFWVVISVLLT